MKTTGAWKVLLTIGALGAASFGTVGCASETDVDESEAAVGSAEATPFDEQYFEVSVAWTSASVSELIHGDPMDYDYTADCKFELSLREDGRAPLLTTQGKPKFDDIAAAEGVLTRDQLTRKSLRTTLSLRCENDEAQRVRSAAFELPPVRFSDKLGAVQTFTVVPALEGKERKDMPLKLSLKVNHSRATAGILSNCSAFSSAQKGSIQKSYLSTDTRFEAPGTPWRTAKISIDGGKLKKEFTINANSRAFVPIAYCRPKAGFGSEGVPIEFVTFQGGKPVLSTTRDGQPIKSNVPMKAGEERFIQHDVTGQSAEFETVVRMY